MSFLADWAEAHRAFAISHGWRSFLTGSRNRRAGKRRYLRGPRFRAGCRGALYTECRVGAKKSPMLLFLAPTLAPHLQRSSPSNSHNIPSLYAFAARSWYSSGSMDDWHSFLILIQ